MKKTFFIILLNSLNILLKC